MTFTWKITEVEVYPTMNKGGVEYRDVIHTVHWSYTAEENGDTQECIDQLKLNLDDLTQFKEYAAVDEATVIGWVEASIPVEDFERMQSALAKCITDRQLPLVSETRTL